MLSQFFLERRAARAFGMKDYKNALEALSDLLSVIGENPNTLHATAVCHQRLGHEDKALDFAERGIAAVPVHLGCLEVLTEVHAARGNLDLAAVFARRALERVEELNADARTPEGAGIGLTSLFKSSTLAAGCRVSSPAWVNWAGALLKDRSGVGKT